MVLTFAAIPLAAADDLKDRKNRVQGDISQTLRHLDQSSSQLVAATQALNTAKVKLASAQKHLAKTRGELAAAEALDQRMQAQLNAAILRLERARAELAEGQANVGEQEKLLGQIAVQNYQTGDPSLLGLSMVLTSQNPAELTSQLNSVQSVLDKESVTLDRLEASRVVLTVKEQEVEEAKVEVAKQRKEAAENLKRKKILKQEAEDAQARVADLVTMRSEAHDAAEQARRADLDQLRGLQQERDRISDMLRKRAEEARRRAAAAAAAAAAADRAKDLGTRKANGFLSYPVNTYITSSYGMRFHPVYHAWNLHDGTDFGASCGTPIRAAAGGRVIAKYFNTGYGNRIIIDHGYHKGRGVGLGTSYNHLSGYSTHVGERVRRGEIIGYVGNTGYSTGCHLHFMVFEDGTTVNPMGWL